MSAAVDDTFLPPRRPLTTGGLDGDTVLPSPNGAEIHIPGDVIDNRYTVIREIGRGGMGVVYEVEDNLLGGRFAIKRLLPELISRQELVEIFKREGANAMRFTSESPRFVTMRYVGTDALGLYLVMDYIDAPTLRTVLSIAADHRLTIPVAYTILQELASALSDLHRLGFIHRDIKPENIFILNPGQDAQVRLVDFGLTKEDVEFTRTSMRGAGSSGYASPEQKKGLPTTPASDIYSFGVIAYEMLSGELPQYGETLSDIVPDTPESLADFIERCLASRVERRIADGVTLQSSFLQLNEPVVATIIHEDVALPQPDINREDFLIDQSVNAFVPHVVEKHTGTLELTGVPDGSQLFLDGKRVEGDRHVCDLTGKSQAIEVVLRHPDYQTLTRSIHMAAGQTTAETIRMERIFKGKITRLEEYPHLKAYVDAMRDIPAGTFQMGRKCLFGDTKPVHTVTLSAFRMGATPVPVAVWKEYCVATGKSLPDPPAWGWLDDHPMVNVSWNDIMGFVLSGGFCAWASDIAGIQLTLPTEAQFEYASRGDQEGLEFPWGDSFDDSNLWCSVKTSRTGTAAVVRSSNVYRNVHGLSDMSGNVWQWCSDLYEPYFRSRQRKSRNSTSIYENKRCVRGGSWYDNLAGDFRCAMRNMYNPENQYLNLGFRLSVVLG